MAKRPPPTNSELPERGDSSAVRCTHCGLPVPSGLVEPDSELQFCCNGCRTVWSVIHGSGLDRFYKLRRDADAAPEQARTTDRRYAELDDTVFADLYVERSDDGACSTELYLEGVHCAACVWLVEKLPQVLPGVIEARLDMRRSLVRVRWNDQRVALSQVARTLDTLGYPPHPAKDARARSLQRQEDRRFLIRIGVAGACAGNVMTLAFALYGGQFSGIESQYEHLFRWASMVCGLIALLWPGSLFLRGAVAAVRTRTVHLDLPIALGLATGGVAGTVNAVLGRGEIYFDSLTMLVFLLLVGRWIQRRQQRWAADAFELLFSITPTSAHRVEDDGLHDVPIEAVGPGDIVEVRAGESVPTDGVVRQGRSTVDASLLTGESQPVSVAPDDAVHAGTVNLQAKIQVRVEAVGQQTRVGRLMHLVEQCSSQRTPIVQAADRVAGWFVVTVVTLACATLALWLWLDPAHAVDRAVALLIVTCPCALGLATPLVVTVALGRAAGRHILIKGGHVLEVLARRGTIVLDKTGTITAGRTRLVGWRGATDVQPLVAALESHSAHPIARALVDAFASADDRSRGARFQRAKEEVKARHVGNVPHEAGQGGGTGGLSARDVADVEQTIGGGMIGTVAQQRLIVGSPAFVRQHNVALSEAMQQAERETIDEGHTPVLVAVDGRCVAVAALGDPVRDDAGDAIGRLRQLGWDVDILSGDHQGVVDGVARRLGVEAAQAVGGATPEQKVARVRSLAAAGPVVMVGDGVNDAAALSAATVGIAVHGGAEASLAAADVYLNRAGLAPIVELVGAGRRTLATIRRSLGVSLVYNAVAASLAVAGLIGPLLAAVLMPISSFTVVALAVAWRTFGDRS